MSEFAEKPGTISPEIIQERALSQLGDIGLSQVSPEAKQAFEAIVIDLTKQVVELETTVDGLRKESLNPVTGLPGRYLYQKEIEAAHARYTRDPESIYGLVMWDVDNLKIVNDRFGHQVGDRYLAAAARSIDTTVRKGDMLFSIGGDEIAGILYGVSDADSMQGLISRVESRFAETIDELKNESQDPGQWEDVRFGISAGYEFPTVGEDIATIEDRADKKMYERKIEAKAKHNSIIEIAPPMLGLNKRLGRISIRIERPKQ